MPTLEPLEENREDLHAVAMAVGAESGEGSTDSNQKGLLSRLRALSRRLLSGEERRDVVVEHDPLIRELYPDGIDSELEQSSEIGDCYLLAAIKNLKVQPELMRQILTKTVRKLHSGYGKLIF